MQRNATTGSSACFLHAGSTTIVFGGFATTVKDYDGHNVYYMVEAGGSADRVMNVFTSYGKITNPYGVAVVSSHLYIAGFDAGEGQIWKLPDIPSWTSPNSVSGRLPWWLLAVHRVQFLL